MGGGGEGMLYCVGVVEGARGNRRKGVCVRRREEGGGGNKRSSHLFPLPPFYLPTPHLTGYRWSERVAYLMVE